MDVIACITFGHESEDIERALRCTVQLDAGRHKVRVIALDDSSGMPLVTLEGIEVTSTPSRMGFAGAVQYLIQVLAPDSGRLVLINPDASISSQTLLRLLEVGSDVAVPRVIDGQGRIENLRGAARPTQQVRNLMLGERRPSVELLRDEETQIEVSCPPYAPSGAVISLNAELLREVPLRPEFFWLEFSDWTYRLARQGRNVKVVVLSDHAEHSGASTSVKFPISVAASQARAKVNFVREYGSILDRALVPIAAGSRGIRFAIKRRRLADGWHVFLSALGKRDWRVTR